MAAVMRPGSSGSLGLIERVPRPGTTGSGGSIASASCASRAPKASAKAACNLRDFFTSRRPGGLALDPAPQRGRAPHAAETLKERHRQARQAQLREAWTQKEIDERGIQKAEEARMQKEMRAEKLRRRAARQAAYDEHCRAKFHEHERRRLEEERAEAEAAEVRRRQEEEEHLENFRRMQEEVLRRRREPKVCQACSGTGVCAKCDGNQVLSQDFFAPVAKDLFAQCRLEFGRKPQGCEACGGYAPGIDGKHAAGTGKCAHCDGHGKIWPEFDTKASRHHKKLSRESRCTTGTHSSNPQSELARTFSSIAERGSQSTPPQVRGGRRGATGQLFGV